MKQTEIDSTGFWHQKYLQRVFRLTIVVPVLALTAACGLFGGDKRPEYQGAEYYKNLEVPPDLTAPDNRDAVTVPTPSDEALQRFRDNNKLETVVTPRFDGVRVVSYAGDSWIEIDNNADKVWAELLKFWETEGLRLVQARPLLGFMETDWTERLGGDPGFIVSLFQRLEPDQKDKFRVRVERFDNDRKTRLYVSHARIERSIYGEDGDEFYWHSIPSDVEAEREIIARMALYAGLNSTQTASLLENYRPYASLVHTDSSQPTALTMTGSMDFVWRRTMRALDRLRMQNIREDKAASTIYFSVGRVSDDKLNIEEDEISESSWVMNWLKGGDDEELSQAKDRQYRLELTDLNGSIQLDVIDNQQTRNTNEDGDVEGTALAEQIRNLLVKNLN